MRNTTLFSLLAVALFLSGCSSTTVVISDERAVVQQPAVLTPAPSTNPDAADAVGTGDPVDESDRGNREGTDGPTNPSDIAIDSGFGLGGAEQIESLLGDCETGSDQACDVLFMLTDFFSPEEDMAVTCGGRSDVPRSFCTEGITLLFDAENADDAEDEFQLHVFDPESEGLDAIVSACQDDADLTACDFLYFRSPPDTEFEVIGATCGGRLEVAIPDCRTALAE